MEQTVMTAIIAALLADEPLVGRAADPEADPPDPGVVGVLNTRDICEEEPGSVATYPCLRVGDGAGESSVPVNNYAHFKERWQAATLIVHTFVKNDAGGRPKCRAIAKRVEQVLLANTVPGTLGWVRATDAIQFEKDKNVWHISRRYAFRYVLEDP